MVLYYIVAVLILLDDKDKFSNCYSLNMKLFLKKYYTF